MSEAEVGGNKAGQGVDTAWIRRGSVGCGLWDVGCGGDRRAIGGILNLGVFEGRIRGEEKRG